MVQAGARHGDRRARLRDSSTGSPAEAGHERMRNARTATRSDYRPPAAGAAIDGELTFDKLADVYNSAHRATRRTSRSTCSCTTPTICVDRCAREFANPCQRFCPAAVYEMVADPAAPAGQAPADQRLQLRALQDLRHHGSLPDHRLGAARGRRRAELREDVATPASPSLAWTPVAFRPLAVSPWLAPRSTGCFCFSERGSRSRRAVKKSRRLTAARRKRRSGTPSLRKTKTTRRPLPLWKTILARAMLAESAERRPLEGWERRRQRFAFGDEESQARRLRRGAVRRRLFFTARRERDPVPESETLATTRSLAPAPADFCHAGVEEEIVRAKRVS